MRGAVAQGRSDQGDARSAHGATAVWRSRARILLNAARSRWDLVLLSAVIITLPLELSKTLFPVQQLEISRLLMVPAILAGVIRVARGARPVPVAFTMAIGFVLVVSTVSFVTTRPSGGLLVATAPIAYAMFAVFVAGIRYDRTAIAVLAMSICASAVYVAAIAIIERVGGFYLWHEGLLDVLGRANATFGDPNITARFLGFGILATLAIFMRGRFRRPTGALILIAIALIAAALVLTQSRFGWVAIAVALIAWLVLTRTSRRSWIGVAVFVAAFALMSIANRTAIERAGEVVSGVNVSLGGNSSGLDLGNLTGAQGEPYTPPRAVPGDEIYRRLPIDEVRLYLIEAGVAMFQDHPLVGVGTGGFSDAITGPYRGFIPADRLPDPVTLPHTAVVQVAAENGWLGLTALAIFLLVIGLSLVRVAARATDRDLRLAAVVVGLSILVIVLSSQAEGRLYVEPYLWLGLGVLMGLVNAASRSSPGATTAAVVPRLP